MKRVLLKLSGEALADPDRCRDRRRELLERTYQREYGPHQGRPDWNAGDGHELHLCCRYIPCGRDEDESHDTVCVRKLHTAVLERRSGKCAGAGLSKEEAVNALEQGEIVFFAGGIGHPYFSTDTATLLRAIEIEADVILLAKAIDGVYDDDPKDNPNAKKYSSVSIDEVIAKNLKVVDMTASILARDNRMPMYVFGLNQENSILKAVEGTIDGTSVTV